MVNVLSCRLYCISGHCYFCHFTLCIIPGVLILFLPVVSILSAVLHKVTYPRQYLFLFEVPPINTTSTLSTRWTYVLIRYLFFICSLSATMHYSRSIRTIYISYVCILITLDFIFRYILHNRYITTRSHIEISTATILTIFHI